MSEAAYPEALPALTHLHWYALERVLGQGGFGITYLAKDTNLDQRVAIKEYLPAEFAIRLPDSSVRARTEALTELYCLGLDRFIQEARTLTRFDHPNIVRVHSVFEYNNTAYIVMRFEEGDTLAAMLDRRGTLPEAELVRILLPVLDGLELVHDAGFIHRDIKPDNIHLSSAGRPVLLDFGSARQAVGSSNTLTILIAPGYAPFEQYYKDPSSQGPWTDIYGLAATAYRAICGQAPPDSVSRSKGILGSTQDILVPASVVGAGRYSGRFLAAVDHALAFGEKERPRTIEEWRRELVGETAVPIATVPQVRALGPAAASQPAVLAGAVTAAATAETSRSSAFGVPPSHGSHEAAQRFAPPWVWALTIIMTAIATAATYFAIESKHGEAPGPVAEQTQPQASPEGTPPAPPNKHSGPVPRHEQPPPVPRMEQPVLAPKAEPALKRDRAVQSATVPTPVPAQKETPPEPITPAPQTPAERMADADTALAEGAAAIEIVQPGARAGEVGAMPGYYYASSSHVVPQDRSAAFDAVYAALVKLGLVIIEQSSDLGVISAEAPSPLPLSIDEFENCAAVDLPYTRESMERLGIRAETSNFDTNGRKTVVRATIGGAPTGSKISFATWLREADSRKTDYAARVYPPPNVLICGLDKTWRSVNEELAAIANRR